MCLLLLMVGAILVLLLSQPDGADASGHSATRSFASPSVDPGGRIEVTITASNYGAFAQVVETIPGAFTFVGSSLPDTAVDARLDAVTFTLLGRSSSRTPCRPLPSRRSSASPASCSTSTRRRSRSEGRPACVSARRSHRPRRPMRLLP